MNRVLLLLAQTSTSGPGGPDRGGPGGPGGPGGLGGPGRGPMGGGRSFVDAGSRHMDNGDMHWWMLVLIAVLVVAVIALVVWLVIMMNRARTGVTSGTASAVAAPPSTPIGPTARQILDERYARGEIDTADYEERRSKLE